MKILLSYGRDSNVPLIEKIKEYLPKDAKGNLLSELPSDMNVFVKPNDQRELAYFGMARKRTMKWKENYHFGEI